MRGYLIYSDPDATPDTTDVSKTSKIGRILHIGTMNDIRNMFNVFTFDDIVITECDMLFGMLSRVSTWAKDKLNAKIPSVEHVESGGDYYMEQLKDFFEQKNAHIGTNSTDFLKKLTEIDLMLNIPLTGGGRQTIRRDKHTSSNATRKKYPQGGGSFMEKAKIKISEMTTRAKTQVKEMKTRADIWKNNDGEGKIWNANVREYIRKSLTGPLGGDDRSDPFMRQIKKINVVPNPDDDHDGSAPGTGAGDDGLAKDMPNMTVEKYFKKMAVPVKRKNTTSYSEIVPEVWGHPLLVLIPFARAMQCDIALYEKEKENFKLQAHIKHKADDEMTTVFKMNPKEFTIHILDNNTDETAYHENVLEYMSNFALIVPKGHYTNSGVGLLKKEREINEQEKAKKILVETSRDAKKRTSDTAELKEINAQLKTIEADLFNLKNTHPAYSMLDTTLKDKVSRILDRYKVDDKSLTSVTFRVRSKKEDDGESSKSNDDENKKTIWWNDSSSSFSYDNFKQTIKNTIRQNISKPRLILRLNDLISKEATLSAKKDQLTTEPSATADV